VENDEEKIIDSVTNNLHWLIDNDRKVTPLKELQGKIWRSGFESGAFKGQYVYNAIMFCL